MEKPKGLQCNSTHPGNSPKMLYDQGKLMMAYVDQVSTRIYIPRVWAVRHRKWLALPKILAQTDGQKSSTILKL